MASPFVKFESDLFLILFMMLFTASYSNILILDTSVLTFHAYTMVFVIFIQFYYPIMITTPMEISMTRLRILVVDGSFPRMVRSLSTLI